MKGVVLSLFHFFLNFVFNFFVILERSEESRSSCVIQSERRIDNMIVESSIMIAFVSRTDFASDPETSPLCF